MQMRRVIESFKMAIHVWIPPHILLSRSRQSAWKQWLVWWTDSVTPSSSTLTSRSRLLFVRWPTTTPTFVELHSPVCASLMDNWARSCGRWQAKWVMFFLRRMLRAHGLFVMRVCRWTELLILLSMHLLVGNLMTTMLSVECILSAIFCAFLSKTGKQYTLLMWLTITATIWLQVEMLHLAPVLPFRNLALFYMRCSRQRACMINHFVKAHGSNQLGSMVGIVSSYLTPYICPLNSDRENMVLEMVFACVCVTLFSLPRNGCAFSRVTLSSGGHNCVQKN